MKKFDFYNETNENIFLNPYISDMTNEELTKKGLISLNNYLENAPFPFQMCLKSAPQNFVKAKAISKSYFLDCSYIYYSNNY